MEFQVREITSPAELATKIHELPAPVRPSEPIVAIDTRTAVMGCRFTIDEQVTKEAVAAMGGSLGDLVYRIILMDKPAGKERGWFIQTTSPDPHEWGVLLPVSDRLEYSDKALHYINVSMLALMRRAIQYHDLVHTVAAPEFAVAITGAAHNEYVAESFTVARSAVDSGLYPLLPSVLPAASELLAEKEQGDGEEG